MEMSLIVKQVWSVAFMSFTIFFVCHKHNSLTLGPIDTSLYLLLLKSSMVNFTFFIIASLQWERDSNAQPRCQNNTTVTIVGTPPPNLLIEFYILVGFWWHASASSLLWLQCRPWAEKFFPPFWPYFKLFFDRSRVIEPQLAFGRSIVSIFI